MATPPPPPRGTEVRIPGPAGAGPLHPADVRRRNLRDVAMLALGVASLGLVAYGFLYGASLPAAEVAQLQAIDLAIVAVFAAEFAWRWRRAEDRGRFVLRNWFDLLGMVPMVVTNIPVFRAFRLLRLGMIASRLLRMWSFLTGERSAQLVLDRYRAALVEEVADRVMLRSIAMVEGSIARGAYPRALGDTLHARRDDLARMAVESGRANELSGWFTMVPGLEAMARRAALAAVDTAVAALRSEEMQRAFEATVRSLSAELKEEVARKEWRERRAAAPATEPAS
jgi:hypothetical protein